MMLHRADNLRSARPQSQIAVRFRPFWLGLSLCLSLTACGPTPNTQPGLTPSATPSASGTPAPTTSASPVSAASLRFRLVADPSLARFKTAQVDDFSLCLAQIARVSTRFTFNGALSSAAGAALSAAGAQVETSGDSHTITFSSAAGLEELLAGVSLSLPELPAGALEGRSTFFDAAGLETGFVTWQATLTGGAQDVTVSLSEAEGAQNQVSNACPRLKANVSGATLRGAGGQMSSGNGGPSANPTPGSSSPSPSPTTTPGAAPGVPTGLQVVEQGGTYLTLQWDFPADARSFKLYLDGRELAADHVTPNYYRFEGLRASTNYQLGVRSVNAAGESEIVDIRGTTLSEGGRSASGNFSSGGNGNTSSSSSGFQAGDEFQVNTYTTNYQFRAEIAVNAEGRHVIVWSSWDQNDEEEGIFAQVYDDDGDPVGDEIHVNTYTGGMQEKPVVAINDDGDFVVSWQTEEITEHGIRFRLFDRDGEPTSPELSPHDTTLGDARTPDVAMDEDGNFVLAWQFTALGNTDVRGRVLDGEGSPLTSDLAINTVTIGTQTLPSVAMDEDGNFMVSWSGAGPGDSDGIFARRFDAEGVAAATEFLINGLTSGNQNSPSLALAESGDFVVAWNGEGPDDGNGVYARRFSRDDEPRDDDFLVNSYTSETQDVASVAMADDGSFVIVWESAYQDEGGGEFTAYGVYGQRYKRSGSREGREFRINQQTLSNQAEPAVGMDADGDFVVVWHSEDQDEGTGYYGPYGVYARRYTRN